MYATTFTTCVEATKEEAIVSEPAAASTKEVPENEDENTLDSGAKILSKKEKEKLKKEREKASRDGLVDFLNLANFFLQAKKKAQAAAKKAAAADEPPDSQVPAAETPVATKNDGNDEGNDDDDGEEAATGTTSKDKKKKKKKPKKDEEVPAPAAGKKKTTGISALKAMMDEKKRIEEEARRREEEERKRIEEEERQAEEEARKKEEEKQRKKEKEKVRSFDLRTKPYGSKYPRPSANWRRKRGAFSQRNRKRNGKWLRDARRLFWPRGFTSRVCSNHLVVAHPRNQCMVTRKRSRLKHHLLQRTHGRDLLRISLSLTLRKHPKLKLWMM